MKVTYIELLGERHPLCFSLAASEALDEAFGGLDRMTQALSSGSLSQTAKAVDMVLQILMKAGRVYCGARGDELPPPLPCRPADLLDVRDGSTVGLILTAISGDSEREVEAASKKAGAARDREAPRGSTTTAPGPD